MSVVRAGIKSGWWKCAKVQGYTENKCMYNLKNIYFLKKISNYICCLILESELNFLKLNTF